MHIQGLLPQAELNYKKAVALFRQNNGTGNVGAAKALLRLGRLYLEWGKLREASNLVQRSRGMVGKTLPQPLLIAFLDTEATLLFQIGKFTDAGRKLTAALKIAEDAYGKDASETWVLLLHLGQVYSTIGDYPSAEAVLNRCLASKEKTSGSDPVDRAIIMSSLAGLYTKQRKYAEAESFALKALDASSASCGATPIACAQVRSVLGDYYVTKNQWGTAERQFETALRLRQKTLGDHPLVANSLASLSRVLLKLKRKKEAKIYAAQASRILSNHRSEMLDRINTIDVRTLRGDHR